MAPPQSVTSKPRWSRYQTPRLLGSADLKNMPPMPVTRFIVFLLQSTSACSTVLSYSKQLAALKAACTWEDWVVGLDTSGQNVAGGDHERSTAVATTLTGY